MDDPEDRVADGHEGADQRDVDHVKRRLTRRLEQLGYTVMLQPQVA